MPSLKLPDGSEVVFTTVDELIEYQEKTRLRPSLQRSDVGTKAMQLRQLQGEVLWQRLMRELADEGHANQRAILSAIKKAGERGTSLLSLAKVLPAGPAVDEVSSQAIGGMIGSISKACERIRLEREDVIVANRGTYYPGPLLKTYKVRVPEQLPDEEEVM